MDSTEQEIKTYIEKALEDQDFKNFEIKLSGSTGKGEGYASYINFATVEATTREGTKKNVELVVKTSKKDFFDIFGKVYQREVYFYQTILPEFTKFQKQNGIQRIFDSVPMVYKMISEEKLVVCVMENLSKNGYDLYDRKKPLDLTHLKLVLSEYGKFHAISFALRDKRKGDFEKLVTNFDDVVLDIFDSFKIMTMTCWDRVCGILKQSGEEKLHEICLGISQRGADIALAEILKTVEPKSAILHGDCWSNNFMYKYENPDLRVPSKVAILDWQISRLHSPVLDLSYFIYSTCSEEQLVHFDELLGIYYASFSTFLKDLGCDPEILFPYSTLQKHWKKYGLYGVFMVTTCLHLALCEKENIPDYTKSDIGEKMTNVEITNDVEYKKRLLGVFRHYWNYDVS